MAETILDSFEIGGDRIVIREVDENDQRIRYLLVNGGEESACYSEPGMHNELKFIYTRKLAQLFEIFPSFQNSLLIGGGGFSLPRYLISHYPDHTMDVVELSPQIVEIAKKYFFLEELREKYDALYLGLGAQIGNRMPVENSDAENNDSNNSSSEENNDSEETNGDDTEKTISGG